MPCPGQPRCWDALPILQLGKLRPHLRAEGSVLGPLCAASLLFLGKLDHCNVDQTPELSPTPLQSHSQPEEEEGEEEEETEELGHAETYADYVPSKCKCLGQGWHGDTR